VTEKGDEIKGLAFNEKEYYVDIKAFFRLKQNQPDKVLTMGIAFTKCKKIKTKRRI
jgi:hypothetical protein